MAKKQTFENKLSKSSSNKNQIKLIRSHLLNGKGSIRFSEEMITVPEGKSTEAHLKDVLSKK
tara:strand:- start:111 stop:296 length:186 start_codon:yes stop_codon:yes gene_type:complete